ncbi:Ca2+/Na+antiporter protein [candidate division SR1 bacterium RAAC1_SR1_1]|nr:Ca2+/Na+antiporter protein [candidate division SR1 bacterium RAAC1_SR1_1]
MIFAIILLILGLLLLGFGANYLITSSVRIAKHFHVSSLLIGLTIIAIGTSAPELFLSGLAAIQGNGALSVGNVIGSNIFNLGFILGLSAIIMPIFIKKKIIYRDGLVLLIITAAVLAMLWDQHVARREGAILLAGLVGYNGYLRIKKDAPTDEEVEISKPKLKNLAYVALGLVALASVHATTIDGNFTVSFGMSLYSGIFLGILGLSFLVAIFKKDIPEFHDIGNGTLMNIIKLIASLGILVLASELVVSAAVYIAQTFGISERAIGATIVAAGTSLPEVAATVAAILKKNYDMGVGNVIGSDIFNILGIIGISSVIAPLNLTSKCVVLTQCDTGFWQLLFRDNIFSVLILFLTLGITFLFMRTGWKLSKREGIILFVFALLRMIFEINPNFFTKWFGG